MHFGADCGGGGTGTNNITVRARGTGGGEQIRLRVNNTIVQTWTLSTSYQDFTRLHFAERRHHG